MDDKNVLRFKWASRILMGVSGLVAICGPVFPAHAQYLTLAVGISAFAARWCEQQIPAR